jgi:hypothetical protein
VPDELLRTRKNRQHEPGPMVSGSRKAAMLPREVLFSFLALAIFVTGCAGRKPVVASAPPPMAPVATPPATADRAIHSTTTPEGGAYIEEGNAPGMERHFMGGALRTAKSTTEQ